MQMLRMTNRKITLVKGAVCALAVAVTVAASAPAAAQSLTSELERLRRELSDLQRYVYSGSTSPPPGAAAASSGTGGELSGDVAARLQIQIQNLERSLQETTGQIEETAFRIRQMEQRLETALGDIEFRLNALEGGAPATSSSGLQSSTQQSATGSASSAAQQIIPVPGASSGTTVISSEGASQSASQQGASQGGAATGLGGGSLGTLIVDGSGNIVGSTVSNTATQGSGQPQTAASGTVDTTPQAAPTTSSVEGSSLDQAGGAAAQSASLPEDPQGLYDHSLGLMRQAEYADAEASLRVFLDRYPDNQLVGAALYWLGETHYVRQDYREAAFAFVDVYSKYPGSNKAPDSLLKLGMSLQALGNTAEACTAFSTLQSEYPDARRAVIRLAEERAAEYGC